MNEKRERSSSVGTHGGEILSMAKKLGCEVTDLIDMSSNLTPLGMVPGLREALIDRLDEIGFLPETGSETLCEVFAAKFGLAREQVLAGNGTTEFIYALPDMLDCQRAVIVNPTYSDYALACQWAGVEAAGFTLPPENDFRLDFTALAATLRGGELVFLCNPNNPTGGLVASATIHEFVKAHPRTVFLVDESYLPFVREPSLLGMKSLDNLFVLGSSSKIYGIPGLRLGFLVSTPANMGRMARYRKPWGVNRMAQVAGEFVLTHGDAYVEEVVRFVETERPALCEGLARLPGVRVVPGSCNFILCALSGSMRAGALRDAMLRHRIIIRNCANIATLDDRYFRLSLKESPVNRRCLEKLGRILEGG